MCKAFTLPGLKSQKVSPVCCKNNLTFETNLQCIDNEIIEHTHEVEDTAAWDLGLTKASVPV